MIYIRLDQRFLKQKNDKKKVYFEKLCNNPQAKIIKVFEEFKKSPSQDK